MKNFFELVKDAQTTVVKRCGGGKTSSHASAYINAQGRLFGATDKYDTHYDIERGTLEDGTVFIKMTEAKPTVDSKGKESYGKALKSSVKSTGAPFITVTKLCKDLFGDRDENGSNWEHDFEDQGEQDGAHYFTLVSEVKETEETEE